MRPLTAAPQADIAGFASQVSRITSASTIGATSAWTRGLRDSARTIQIATIGNPETLLISRIGEFSNNGLRPRVEQVRDQVENDRWKKQRKHQAETDDVDVDQVPALPPLLEERKENAELEQHVDPVENFETYSTGIG